MRISRWLLPFCLTGAALIAGTSAFNVEMTNEHEVAFFKYLFAVGLRLGIAMVLGSVALLLVVKRLIRERSASSQVRVASTSENV